MADKAIAANLANELSEEIGSKLFQEPAAADVDSLGADFGETRSTYDDIDDYQGMTNTPPQLSDSTKLTNLANWSRVVRIDHVSVNDPSAQSAVYTGLKRVTVTVNKNGVELASIISLHAHAADQIGFVIEHIALESKDAQVTARSPDGGVDLVNPGFRESFFEPLGRFDAPAVGCGNGAAEIGNVDFFSLLQFLKHIAETLAGFHQFGFDGVVSRRCSLG